jgi:hypothetical protein
MGSPILRNGEIILSPDIAQGDVRYASLRVQDEDAREDIAGQPLGADPSGSELLLAVARVGVLRRIPGEQRVGARKAIADARREIVERVDLPAVDPDVDAGLGQGLGERIDLRLVLA